jgi:hypothetical protein
LQWRCNPAATKIVKKEGAERVEARGAALLAELI